MDLRVALSSECFYNPLSWHPLTNCHRMLYSVLDGTSFWQFWGISFARSTALPAVAHHLYLSRLLHELLPKPLYVFLHSGVLKCFGATVPGSPLSSA